MARLVSNIGKEQRKQTANARKALLYRQMAEAIRDHDDGMIAGFPKYVPRGKPIVWYLERAEQAEQVSATAGEMASLLVDMKHRNRLAQMTPQEAWDDLVGSCGLHGDEINSDLEDILPWSRRGRLQTLTFFIDQVVEDLPYLAPKLTTAQRHEAREFLRAKMEDLLEAFDG
jgi:hypothetical protein